MNDAPTDSISEAFWKWNYGSFDPDITRMRYDVPALEYNSDAEEDDPEPTPLGEKYRAGAKK